MRPVIAKQHCRAWSHSCTRALAFAAEDLNGQCSVKLTSRGFATAVDERHLTVTSPATGEPRNAAPAARRGGGRLRGHRVEGGCGTPARIRLGEARGRAAQDLVALFKWPARAL